MTSPHSIGIELNGETLNVTDNDQDESTKEKLLAAIPQNGEARPCTENGEARPCTENGEAGPCTENEATKQVKQSGQHKPPSEIVSEADIKDLIPQPPDGGWGWVIVFVSFMNHFIVDGICYAFGTMLSTYAEYFQSSAAATGALMSTITGCYLLSAPVASALVNKYGCRVVGMVGATIAAISFIVSTFSETIEVLIVTLGVCGGIGFGLMYLPAVVSVSMYFEKRRAIAIGIATCGTGLGTFTFGPVGKWLMRELDWKNAHYVLACVILQGIVLYALVFPLALRKITEQGQCQHKGEEHVANSKKKPNSANNRMAPKVHAVDHNNLGSIRLHRSTAFIGSVSKVPTTTTLTVEQADDLRRPMYKKDVFYSGSIYNLQEFKNVPNVQDYVASIISLPAMQEDQTRKMNICPCNCLPDQMTDVLNEMLDVSLFKSKSFNIIIFSTLVITFAYFIPFTYSEARAVEEGVDPADAPFLVSILGVSTMMGRLGACLLATVPRVRALILHNVCLLGGGLAGILIPLCDTYVTMAIAAFGYGFCMGGHVSLSPLILVDVLGLSRLTTSFGLMTLARGVSTLAGPVIGGYLHDTTGSYDSAFYMAGTLIFVSAVGFSLLYVPCVKREQSATS